MLMLSCSTTHLLAPNINRWRQIYLKANLELTTHNHDVGRQIVPRSSDIQDTLRCYFAAHHQHLGAVC
eukprot:scaffold5108_cov119-Skeletonema_menzelii.AAC.2